MVGHQTLQADIILGFEVCDNMVGDNTLMKYQDISVESI